MGIRKRLHFAISRMFWKTFGAIILIFSEHTFLRRFQLWKLFSWKNDLFLHIFWKISLDVLPHKFLSFTSPPYKVHMPLESMMSRIELWHSRRVCISHFCAFNGNLLAFPFSNLAFEIFERIRNSNLLWRQIFFFTNFEKFPFFVLCYNFLTNQSPPYKAYIFWKVTG